MTEEMKTPSKMTYLLSGYDSFSLLCEIIFTTE